MNFNSRETYLSAVASWKADYAQITLDIRRKKIEVKEANRKREPTWKHLLQLSSYRQTASSLLEERAQGKIEAQRQYLELLSAKTFA